MKYLETLITFIVYCSVLTNVFKIVVKGENNTKPYSFENVLTFALIFTLMLHDIIRGFNDK